MERYTELSACSICGAEGFASLADLAGCWTGGEMRCNDTGACGTRARQRMEKLQKENTELQKKLGQVSE